MPTASLGDVMPLAEELTQVLSRCCESTSEDCMAREVRQSMWSCDVLSTVNWLPVFSAAFHVHYSASSHAFMKYKYILKYDSQMRGSVIWNHTNSDKNSQAYKDKIPRFPSPVLCRVSITLTWLFKFNYSFQYCI